MSKRRISAKGVIADLRSGLDNTALMEKYGLSASGLQSLFDKLLSSGAIDLGEIRDRMPGKWGTIPIREEKFLRLINAQEAARDLRAGLADAEFMHKYQLSFNGLQTLFDKLVEMKVITRLDLDERRFSSLDRVDLADDTVDLSTVIEQMFGQRSAQSLSTDTDRPSQAVEGNIVKTAPPSNGKRISQEPATKSISAGNGKRKSPPQEEVEPSPPDIPWYDRPVIVVALLISLFPLGFHALFRNRTLSHRVKGGIVIVWLILAVAISLKVLIDLA